MRPALRADLADPAVLACGGNHGRAFRNVVAGRLFDVHVFAGLHGPDGTQGVPVVGRRGTDQIDRRVLECLAHVPHEFRLDPLLLRDLFALAEPHFLVRVDQVQDHRPRIAKKSADVIAASTADADDGHSQFSVGIFGLGDVGGGGKSGGRSHRCLQETTAIDSGHGVLLRRETERLTPDAVENGAFRLTRSQRRRRSVVHAVAVGSGLNEPIATAYFITDFDIRCTARPPGKATPAEP